jgi:orotate phosphoribosyltransferase
MATEPTPDRPRPPADLARRVHAASHLTGTFVLRSGATSDEYFDKYRFESDPRLLRELAEAMAVAGRRLVVVEDVVTSAGAVVEACHALRSEGAEVAVALCVIDRQAGGPARLAEIGVELRPLFTMSELKEVASR